MDIYTRIKKAKTIKELASRIRQFNSSIVVELRQAHHKVVFLRKYSKGYIKL